MCSKQPCLTRPSRSDLTAHSDKVLQSCTFVLLGSAIRETLSACSTSKYLCVPNFARGLSAIVSCNTYLDRAIQTTLVPLERTYEMSSSSASLQTSVDTNGTWRPVSNFLPLSLPSPVAARARASRLLLAMSSSFLLARSCASHFRQHIYQANQKFPLQTRLRVAGLRAPDIHASLITYAYYEPQLRVMMQQCANKV
jgi:hypothetical protein